MESDADKPTVVIIDELAKVSPELLARLAENVDAITPTLAFSGLIQTESAPPVMPFWKDLLPETPAPLPGSQLCACELPPIVTRARRVLHPRGIRWTSNDLASAPEAAGMSPEEKETLRELSIEARANALSIDLQRKFGEDDEYLPLNEWESVP